MEDTSKPQAIRAIGNVKLVIDVMSKFDGSQNLYVWRKRLEKLCRMQSIDDIPGIMPFILEGNALSIYMEMSDENQNKYAEIIKTLEKSFGLSSRVAYTRLKNTSLSTQTIDEYASEIKQLVSVVDNWEKTAFLAGLPTELAVYLERDGTDKMDELVEKARTYLNILRDETQYSMVSASNKFVGSGGVSHSKSNVYKKPEMPDDPKSMADESRLKNSRSSIICFNCGGKGHISRQCASKNVKGK